MGSSKHSAAIGALVTATGLATLIGIADTGPAPTTTSVAEPVSDESVLQPTATVVEDPRFSLDGVPDSVTDALASLGYLGREDPDELPQSIVRTLSSNGVVMTIEEGG